MATTAAYIDLGEGAAPATPGAGKVRIYAKTDGSAYQKDDAGTETGLAGGGGGASNLASARYQRTSGNYTTTSTSFVDVDPTNMALTIATGARRVLIGFTGSCFNSGPDTVFFDVAIDGTRMGGAFGLMGENEGTGAYRNLSFFEVSAVLSAGSHTFKLQWRNVNGTTTTMPGATASSSTHPTFWVVELYAA